MKLLKRKNDQMVNDIKQMESQLELVKQIQKNVNKFSNLKDPQIKLKIENIKSKQEGKNKEINKPPSFKIKSGKSPFLSNKLTFLLRNNKESSNEDTNNVEKIFDEYISSKESQFDQILEKINLINKKDELIKTNIYDLDSLKNAPIEKLNNLYITAKSQKLINSILDKHTFSKDSSTFTENQNENNLNGNLKNSNSNNIINKDWKKGTFIFGGKNLNKSKKEDEASNKHQRVALTACLRCLVVLNINESLSYQSEDFCSPNCIYDYSEEINQKINNEKIKMENKLNQLNKNNTNHELLSFQDNNENINTEFNFESF